MTPGKAEDPGPRSVGDVDRLVHEPARLMILMYLSSLEEADYLFLVRATGLTGGNLSSHLSKLEAAGYVAITKRFLNKKPNSLVRLTKSGHAAVRDYTRTMRRALTQIKG
ncbi:MAG TPA: transcriptional regulator [Anaerolineales bacterium]|nr:transcriptional regulator [Anaerolineales bacterium]